MTESAPRYRLTAPPPALERDEQIALMRWARVCEGTYPALKWLIAIPNGLAASSRGEAARMKAQGMKSGVPDLLLPYPCGGYAGLWIELKRRSGGKLSAPQQDWLTYLGHVGYCAVCCRGWDEARERIEAYLAHDHKKPAEWAGSCAGDNRLIIKGYPS